VPAPALPAAGAPFSLRTKLTWVGILYFAQGFPFGLAYDLWPVYFRVHGVSLREIGLMALLFLPYSLKPAWSPFVDRFGSRQAWIAGCEFALAGVTVALLLLDPTRTDWLLWVVLLSYTAFSATQDISIDAYAVDISTPQEVGPINGLRATTGRLGILTAGGALLILADFGWFGWTGAWVAATAICLAMGVAAFVSPRVPRERAGTRRAGEQIGALAGYRVGLLCLFAALLGASYAAGWPGWLLTMTVVAGACGLASFLSPELLRWLLRWEMLPVVGFILVYKIGDSTLGRMVKPFWVDRGYSESEIGLISVTIGAYLTIAGALSAGWFIARRGVFQGLVWMGLAQLVSNLGYVAVAGLELPRWSIYGASVIESFCQGLGTAAFLSFLMVICDRAHAATQYALLSAAFALTRDLAGAFTGIGVEAWGYTAFFLATTLLALPGLALLPAIRGRVREREQPAAT
jgi:PAT family beta-lactamase induction signal transducer AmpG